MTMFLLRMEAWKGLRKVFLWDFAFEVALHPQIVRIYSWVWSSYFLLLFHRKSFFFTLLFMVCAKFSSQCMWIAFELWNFFSATSYIFPPANFAHSLQRNAVHRVVALITSRWTVHQALWVSKRLEEQEENVPCPWRCSVASSLVNLKGYHILFIFIFQLPVFKKSV